MNKSIDVQIVMATYNGEAHLREQMSSIFLQKFKGFDLLIHDDGSNDATLEIIYNQVLKNDEVKILNHPALGGAKRNFNFLLQESNANYILCADQDDIWLPDKVSILLTAMQFYESVYGIDVPILVHSDLKLIDDNGRPISDSFWDYQHLDPRWGDHFNLLLTQNVVTGCAMMINRALLERAMPIPEQAVMHDWWLGLVASTFGKIVWIKETTVLYRQHQTNAVGAKAFNISYLVKKAIEFSDSRLRHLSQDMCVAQADAFARRFPDTPAAETARNFVKLATASPGERRRIIRQEKFYKIGAFRNIAWMWLF